MKKRCAAANRLDTESMRFHEEVRKGYHAIVERYPQRFVVLDGAKSREEVLQGALAAVTQRREVQ